MNLGLIGLLMPSDEVLKILGGQSLTAMEQAFGSNMLKILDARMDRVRTEKNLLYISSGLAAVGLNNIMPEGSKVGALTDTAARLVARMGAKDLFDTFNELWEKDPQIRKMLKEGGELHGVTDRSIIINTTAAFYAAQMAKNSRFRDVYSYSTSWASDDDDDECYNAPGTTGNATIIDLSDILKEDAAKRAIKDNNLISVNKEFVADATRSYFQVNISGDNCTIIMSANDPQAKQEAKYRHKGKEEWRKMPIDEVWPNSVCGSCNFPLDKYESRVTKAEASPLRHADGSFMESASAPLAEVMKARGYDVKKMEVDRSTLNAYLTRLLDEAINPGLMDSKVYTIEDAIKSPLDNRGVSPTLSTIYNMPVAGESVGPITPSEDVAPTTAAQPPMDGLRFPLTKRDCYVADGNYKCYRCGKEGFAKSKINAYKPSTLEGFVPADDAGLEDSQQWAESAVCGPCARELKEGREKVIAKYRPSKEDKALMAAEAEVEVMSKAAEEALAACVAAEEGVKQREADIAKMKEAGINILDVVAKDLEDAKYNLVTAEGAVATMELKVKEATQKVDALKNGSAKPSSEKKAATANKASVISKPEQEDIVKAIAGESGVTKNNTKKMSRAEKKRVAALARKSSANTAPKK